MSKEKPPVHKLPTVEQINDMNLKSKSVPPGLGRRERRFLEKRLRKHKTSVIPVLSVCRLESANNLLEEEDVQICKQELVNYEALQEVTKLTLDAYRLYRAVEVPDSSLRTYFMHNVDHKIEQGEVTNLWRQANPRRIQSRIKAIEAQNKKYKEYANRNGNKLIIDEDEDDTVRILLDLQEISIEDIFKEILRIRAENIELIKLQIAWLEAKNEDQLIQAPEQVTKNTEDEIPVIHASKQPFSLSEWNLFWTKNFWSTDTNHLTPIPVNSRENTLEHITSLTRGEISVKPSSILRALEFHLQKDVIQKALATRNRYGVEGTKDWVKIKRGKDRIFFRVLEEQRTAVFFVAGRDEVYRTLA